MLHSDNMLLFPDSQVVNSCAQRPETVYGRAVHDGSVITDFHLVARRPKCKILDFKIQPPDLFLHSVIIRYDAVIKYRIKIYTVVNNL